MAEVPVVGGGAVEEAGSAPEASSTLKGVLISNDGNGGFTIQEMEDGNPIGEPTAAKSIDEAMGSASSLLGGGGEALGDPEAEGMETREEEQSEEMGADPESLDEEKAKYAQKRGTRPKSTPDWSDYMTGGNPTAK